MSIEWGSLLASKSLDAGIEIAVRPGLLDRIARLLRISQLRVALLGASGTGKTALFDCLTEGESLNNPPVTTAMPAWRWLRSRKRIRVCDVPGQDSRVQWDTLNDILRRRPVDGIIYVVSYGYISVRTSIASEAVTRSLPGGLRQYLKVSRSEERKNLEDLLTRLRDSHRLGTKPLWIMVVPTKVDLYYDELDGAEQYYSGSSPFTSLVDEYMQKIGKDRITWLAMPCCGRMEEFKLAEKIEKRPVIDDNLRLHLQAGLRKKIEDMAT